MQTYKQKIESKSLARNCYLSRESTMHDATDSWELHEEEEWLARPDGHCNKATNANCIQFDDLPVLNTDDLEMTNSI